MESLLSFLMIFLFLSCTLVSCKSYTELIRPNFTASNFQFIDDSGAFLFSRNRTFKALMSNSNPRGANFYLCVIHVSSNSIIWSANRDNPVSNAGVMYLTANGMSITDQNGNIKWSTPKIQSSVSGLLLNEMGNLILLDQNNGSLWESFHYPTDTIVIGQQLPVGTSLTGAKSDSDLSSGDYQLQLSNSDAILQWYGQTYWKFSMETNVYINSNYMVDYMAVNNTGLYLLGLNGTEVVIQVAFAVSGFRIAKLGSSGQLMVSSFSSGGWKQEFTGPSDGCRIPSVCGRIGLCTDNAVSNTPLCSCPTNFRSSSQGSSGCVPVDGSSLPSACANSNTSQLNSSAVLLYMSIGYGYQYFATSFLEPIKYGITLTACEDVCSSNCSCLGVFFDNSSGNCYTVESMLGSIIASTPGESDLLGSIKVLQSSPTNTNDIGNHGDKGFPQAILILVPCTAFALMIALGYLWWRRRKASGKAIKLGQLNMFSSEELEAFDIPGLPKRFDYKELEIATDNFKTLIGSGGFGSVYKAILSDKTVVAVKKITNLGLQGKKEFCTEIAVIGNIHHVNLVKLRGFCAQGGVRMLVYEYMNRGSLDRILFGNGPVLEWQERFDIVLGTARGLAYLHSGCEHKIIHCDIKPENILLHDNFQSKISDFGLSKLLSPQESSLFTTMRGTRGYLAPEWLTNSAISEKTDVYSFGMVVLEIVSGRKNCLMRNQSHSLDDDTSGSRSSSSSGTGLMYFPLFALEMHEHRRYLELVDPRLENRVTSEEVEKLVRVALCCVHEEPSLRPNMVTVVGMLEGGVSLGHPRMESLNFLRFYGRRFTEASTIEENQDAQILLYPQANASLTSSAIVSHKTLSYVSSQQVSGPR